MGCSGFVGSNLPPMLANLTAISLALTFPTGTRSLRRLPLLQEADFNDVSRQVGLLDRGEELHDLRLPAGVRPPGDGEHLL